MNAALVENCKKLLKAMDEGKLGPVEMPEDQHPDFKNNKEAQMSYFSLPMALNYQRNSFTLWKGVLEAYEDKETRDIFDVKKVAKMSAEKLQKKLLKYKVALQPNKHTATWLTIAKAVAHTWGSFENMFKAHDYDFLKLKETIQKTHKKQFPYLSGPKIFNYWSSILPIYANTKLKNAEYIEMAVDTHVLQCSVKLGIVTPDEAEKISPEVVYTRWREALHGSDITPTQMHFVLWFWSRNGFLYNLH
jgi:hypothetical protein